MTFRGTPRCQGRGNRGSCKPDTPRTPGRAGPVRSRPRNFQSRVRTDLDAACRELDADGGLRFQRELVACEPAEQVRLADARVADEHHLEQVVVTARQQRNQRQEDVRLPRGAPPGGGPRKQGSPAANRPRRRAERIRTRRLACDSSCRLFTAAQLSGEPGTRLRLAFL